MIFHTIARQIVTNSQFRIGSVARCASSIPSFMLSTASSSSSGHRPTNYNIAFSTSAASAPSTASLVKQLRELTGAPMMECKKALSSPEVDFDLDKAKEWLRKYGSAKASSKVAGREALEGLVGICITEEGASLAKVASETDFASRSEVFSSFVQDVADAAFQSGSTDGQVDIKNFVESAKNKEGKLLSESLNDAILAIRENIQVDTVTTMKASTSQSVFGGYVHGRAPNSSCGTAAAVVEIAPSNEADVSSEEKEKLGETAKKLAMHVVAAKPLYLNPESVPEDVVAKEKEILTEKMGNTNKPPEIMEKIITGQLRKFYEGICLTEQAHMVEEGNPKVLKVLKELGVDVKNYQLVGMTKS